MSLTKREILDASDRSPEALDVSEWGGEVYIAALMECDWKRLQREMIAAQKKAEDTSHVDLELVAVVQLKGFGG